MRDREPGEIKRARRIRVEAEALLIDSDGAQTPVSVIDLSADGCRVRSDTMLLIGERVRLRVGRVADYPAQVRWTRENEAGLAFTGPSSAVD